MTWLAPLAIAALLLGQQAGAATIFSDSFDGETAGLDTRPSNWILRRGSVDVIGNGFFDFYPGNGLYVDLDGSSNRSGLISTRKLRLDVGATYRIVFDYGVNGTARERLRFGMLGVDRVIFNRGIAEGGLPALRRLNRTFVAEETRMALFFQTFGNDNRGPIIDDVRLVRIADAPDAGNAVPAPSVVPLPGSGGLMPGVLAALGPGAHYARIRRAARGAK